MGIKNKIKPNVCNIVIDLWKHGYSSSQIGSMVGIHCATAQQIITRYKKNQTDVDEETYQRVAPELDGGKILALYKARWTLEQIAADMNVSEALIRRYIKEEGLINE